jgi:hypothetical protein
MPKKITADEVLAELARIEMEYDEGPRGFTTDEASELWGTSMATTRLKIRRLIKEGKVRHAGPRKIIGIDGKRKEAPVYQVVRK